MFVGEAGLPEGVRIYAIGDVHGRFDCLCDLLDQIDRDIDANEVATSRIVMLGDYCDRGPQSAQVIDRLAERAASDDFVCLMGNHDETLIRFLVEGGEAGASFFSFGGDTTLQSYGIDSRAFSSYAEVSAELSRRMPKAHIAFLTGLKFSHEEGDYFFCHAGVRPGIPLDSQTKYDLIWIRGEFLLHHGSLGKVVVHGHTPHFAVDVQPNRINVDTCAYDSGVLSCVVLEGKDHRFLQTQL